jgi:hypothetical protein
MNEYTITIKEKGVIGVWVLPVEVSVMVARDARQVRDLIKKSLEVNEGVSVD